MTSALGLKLQEAIEQAEARKAMANWTEPTPMTTPMDTTSTLTVTEATFNAVRDNPGLTKTEVGKMLELKGYKFQSTTSLVSVMLGYGLIIQEEGKLRAIGDTYKSRVEFNARLSRKRKAKKEIRMIRRPVVVADTPASDPVNHPSHYKVGGIETIDFIKAKLTGEQLKGYYLGNLLKYLSRAEYKNGSEDFKKAQVYLQWLTELEDRETSQTLAKPSGD